MTELLLPPTSVRGGGSKTLLLPLTTTCYWLLGLSRGITLFAYLQDGLNKKATLDKHKSLWHITLQPTYGATRCSFRLWGRWLTLPPIKKRKDKKMDFLDSDKLPFNSENNDIVYTFNVDSETDNALLQLSEKTHLSVNSLLTASILNLIIQHYS